MPISLQKYCTIFLAFFLFLPNEKALSVSPHRSAVYFPSANGLCVASYNLNLQKITSFKPYVMDVWDVGYSTPNLIQAAGFKIEISGERFDFSSIPITHIGYENGTGIIRIDQKIEQLTLTSYVWTPMILDFKVMLMVVHIPNAFRYNLQEENIRPYVLSTNPDLEQIEISYSTGRDLWVGLALIYTRGIKEKTLKELRKELSGAKPQLLVEAEKRWWMHWHRAGHIPSEIILKKYEVLLQSLAFIKMAQSREPGRGKGQIVNHLSPVYESVATVRDMAYAINALVKTAHYKEAKAALEFLVNANSGHYLYKRSKSHKWGMNRRYLISLSHYTGLGYEKYHSRKGRPLIYYDTQGLFLWATGEYVRESTDLEFLNKYWDRIRKRVVQPLMELTDDTGLIRRDSGLWDAPYPGLHFSYTSFSAYLGLNSAATIAHLAGHDDVVPKYIKKAADLRTSILSRLTVGKFKVISRCLEIKSFPYLLDASAVEAINWQVLKPEWKTASSTLKELDTYLRVGRKPRGFALAYQGKNLKGPENLFIDLRAVQAMKRMGKKKRAKQLLDWVIDQASLNGEMIPRSFSASSANYVGPYPMIGQGAAVFVLAVLADN